MRLLGVWMFMRVNDGSPDENDWKLKKNKTIFLVKFSDFLKKSLQIGCSLGGLRYTCPNLTRTIHLKALFSVIKCCKRAAIFQVRFWADFVNFKTRNWVGRRFDPHISLDCFLGSPGHQNSSPSKAQPVITSLWFWTKSWAHLVVGINRYAARMGWETHKPLCPDYNLTRILSHVSWM